MRSVSSFVRRSGRLTPRQKVGLSDYLPRYLFPLTSESGGFDPFSNALAPIILDVGFGMGDALLCMAEDNPGIHFIGVEVHEPGLGALAARLYETGLANVQIVSADVVTFLQTHIPFRSLTGIQIFFPDPWPKKKHHKRRLLDEAFVVFLATKLLPGGFLHCATDWPDYAEVIEQAMNKHFEVESGRPWTRPYTKFELRAERLGHKVWDFIGYLPPR